jgi:AraC-like DNA-binding protein
MFDTAVFLSIAVHSCLGIVFIIGKWDYRRLFGILFIFIAFIQYQFHLVYSKKLLYYPDLFLTYVPAVLLLGPIFYVLFQRLVFNVIMPPLVLLRHFLVPGLSIVALVPMLFTNPDEKLALIHSLYYEKTTAEYVFLSVLCVGSLVFYISLLINALPSIQRMKTKEAMTYVLFSILLTSIAFSGLAFASQIIHSLFLLHVSNALFSILILGSYLLHIRFSFFMNELFEEIRRLNDRQSHLINVNVNKALANLNYVIHTEKVYKNPNLSLASLAKQLNLTVHQLSELLNIQIGKSFYNYITEFRIKDAIDELKNNPNTTILSIALSVGFNSNSAFYTAFKKVTGKSPSDYRA